MADPSGAAAPAVLVPLSPAQESMWLEQRLHPTETNGGFLSVVLRGDVTAAQVRAACLRVCEDNPQLRGLVVDGPEARMAIRPASEVLRFEEVPLTAAPGEEAAAARRWYGDHRPHPWDLTVRPPVSFFLLHHGERRHTLVVGVHHIAFDGRSKFVFARQFLSALGAARSPGGLAPGVPCDLPEHPDIDEELGAVLQHWLAADLRTLPGLALPRADLAGPGAGQVRPTPRFDLPAEDCARLRALTAGAGVSFFTGLLACLAAVLAEYGNTRFVVGVPVDTSVPETRDRIGLQINVVPCLIEVDEEATFRDLLAVCGRALELVRRHRRVPFGRVVRELRRRYGVDVGQGAFDRIGLSYPTVAADVGQVPGLDCHWDFFAPNSTRSFELILQLRREGDAVYGRLDFAASGLDPRNAVRLTHDFARLLGRATERPDLPLHRLSPGHVRPAGPGPAPAPAHGGAPDTAARGSFASLAAAAAARDTSRVAYCPVEQFLPTGAVRDFSLAGGRILLDVVDPVLGRLGACAWRADDPHGLWLTDPAPGRDLRVTGPAGRPLPRGLAGLLGTVDDPGPGSFRAWVDGAGRVRLLGVAGQVHPWAGRSLDRAEATAVLAALPGVREAAVVVETGDGGAVTKVSAVVVPVEGAAAEGREWRRAVQRVWPHGWPRPAVRVAGRLPRNAAGTVDETALGAV